MRITRLVVEGIGPYRQRQEVDFAALGASDLFLIDGPTGAGKSTLIDAITFALFGAPSKDATDGRIRSRLCRPDEPSAVELTFTVAGEEYQIRRTPAYLRPALRGSGLTEEKASVSLRHRTAAGHEDAVLTSAAEVGKAITEALGGLGREQFRQLVVLPQGKFAELLHASAAARKESLKTLIGQPLYEAIQADLKAVGDQAAARRKGAADLIGTTAANIIGAITTLPEEPYRAAGAVFAADAERTDPDALRAGAQSLVRAVADGLTAAGVIVAAQDEAREAAAARHQTLVDALTAHRRAAAAHATVAACRAALDDAERTLSVDDLGVVRTGLLHRLGELTPYLEWERAAGERVRARQELTERRSLLLDERQTVTTDLEDLPRQRQALGAQRDAAVQMAAQRGAFAVAKSTAEQQQTALAKVARARTELDRVEAAERSAYEKLQAADTTYRERDDAHRGLLSLQWRQRAAHLATELQSGHPCPVCGATDHPAPAQSDGDDLVSEVSVQQAESATQAAKQARDTAATNHVKAQADVTGAQQVLATAQGQAGDATAESVAAALAAAVKGLEDCDQAEETVRVTGGQLDGLASAEDRLRTRLADIARDVVTIDTRLDQQHREEAEKQTWIAEHTGDYPTVADAHDALSARAQAIDDLLVAEQKVREALAAIAADQRERSVDDLAVAVDAAQADLNAANASLQAAHDAKAPLEVASNALATLTAELATALDRSAEILRETEAPIRLAGLVQASRSANLKGTQLEDFAMQRRFETVLEAASQHLERMSAGRFSFALDRSKQGNAHAGLGIDIIDGRANSEHSDGRRDPRTLSGGETFYASLALALGLADVVRSEAGGVPLETLFVDEGFGSLDAATLQIVMDEITRLRDAGRKVGLISHVEEMKNWIPERLVVRPLGNGESCIEAPGAATANSPNRDQSL